MTSNYWPSVVLVSALALGGSPAFGAQPRAQDCEQQWLDNSGRWVHRAQPDYKGLLEYWLTQGDRCAGTVTYEARLAWIHFYLEDNQEARRVLSRARDERSPYYSLVEWLALSLDISEIDTLPEPQRPAALSQGRAKLEAFTRKYPKSGEGFSMLGSLLTYLEDWPAALRALDSANRLAGDEKSKMGVYRNYTIVYTELERFPEAIAAADKALAYTTSLRSDPPLMLALMRSYVGLGRNEEAQEVAQTLVDLVPGVHKTPQFERAVAKMKDFLDRAKTTKGAGSRP